MTISKNEAHAKSLAHEAIQRIDTQIVSGHLDIHKSSKGDGREVPAIMEALSEVKVVLPQDLDAIRSEAASQALLDAAAYINHWIKAGADDPIHPYETAQWLEERAKNPELLQS